jgi:hypothetical protein
MKNIEKEDINIAITKSAMNKMKFIFPENESVKYTSVGREYGGYDVPVYIVLHDFAYGKSLIETYAKCVNQMQSHGLSPDANILNLIVRNVKDFCQDEISLVREVDRRISTGEEPETVYGDIINLLD